MYMYIYIYIYIHIYTYKHTQTQEAKTVIKTLIYYDVPVVVYSSRYGLCGLLQSIFYEGSAKHKDMLHALSVLSWPTNQYQIDYR